MRAGGSLSDWPAFPNIESEHVVVGAHVHANRKSLITSLPVAQRGKIAEIGVWQGAFSNFLASELAPRQFFAFDVFTGHTLPEWHGVTGQQLFEGLTHREFYEREMARFRDIMVVVEGSSAVTLRDYTDRSFDFVYVDGDHSYEAVQADAALAVEMVSENGFLIFNDYTLRDPIDCSPYGVVPVVNDLVVNHGWQVVGYALQEGLYCDIALRRACNGPTLNGRGRGKELRAALGALAYAVAPRLGLWGKVKTLTARK